MLILLKSECYLFIYFQAFKLLEIENSYYVVILRIGWYPKYCGIDLHYLQVNHFYAFFTSKDLIGFLFLHQENFLLKRNIVFMNFWN